MTGKCPHPPFIPRRHWLAPYRRPSCTSCARIYPASVRTLPAIPVEEGATMLFSGIETSWGCLVFPAPCPPERIAEMGAAAAAPPLPPPSPSRLPPSPAPGGSEGCRDGGTHTAKVRPPWWAVSVATQYTRMGGPVGGVNGAFWAVSAFKTGSSPGRKVVAGGQENSCRNCRSTCVHVAEQEINWTRSLP